VLSGDSGCKPRPHTLERLRDAPRRHVPTHELKRRAGSIDALAEQSLFNTNHTKPKITVSCPLESDDACQASVPEHLGAGNLRGRGSYTTAWERHGHA
jgi:hypothetical protein